MPGLENDGMSPVRKKRLLWASLLALVPWLGLVSWITAGGRTELHQVDCIIVLGARSLADGTPGPTLKARLDKGISLHKSGWAPFLLLTGGLGGDGSVEGEVGRNYALAQSVPAANLEYEGESHNTRDNLINARQIMRKRGWHSCLIVTDPFHIRRSLLLAGDLGLQAYPAPTFEGPNWLNWYDWSLFTGRECFSMAKYLWQRWTRPVSS